MKRIVHTMILYYLIFNYAPYDFNLIKIYATKLFFIIIIIIIIIIAIIIITIFFSYRISHISFVVPTLEVISDICTLPSRNPVPDESMFFHHYYLFLIQTVLLKIS
jgi:hypothetical protein